MTWKILYIHGKEYLKIDNWKCKLSIWTWKKWTQNWTKENSKCLSHFGTFYAFVCRDISVVEFFRHLWRLMIFLINKYLETQENTISILEFKQNIPYQNNCNYRINMETLDKHLKKILKQFWHIKHWLELEMELEFDDTQ